MPFGLFFAAIYFSLFCSVLAVRSFLWPQSLARPGSFLLLCCSLALAVGLFGGRRWARWLAIAAAAVTAPVALRAFAAQAALLDLIWLLGNLLVILLLALPVTGRDSRRPAERDSKRLGGAGWTALCSLIAMVVVMLALPSGEASAPSGSVASAAMPASARAPSAVEWLDFAEGVRRAGSDGRPLLVTFVTDWCPYCGKMDRKTWRAPSVVRAMQDMIAVRVDAEEQSAPEGPSGAELAEMYDVRGFPVQLLLDDGGRILARSDGYQSAGELLDWLRRNGAGS